MEYLKLGSMDHKTASPTPFHNVVTGQLLG